jgi:hypothetical protein
MTLRAYTIVPNSFVHLNLLWKENLQRMERNKPMPSWIAMLWNREHRKANGER